LYIGPIEKKIKKYINKNGTICFILIDTEVITKEKAVNIAKRSEITGSLGILIGGSTGISQLELNEMIKSLKSVTSLPIILFPGNITGISPEADAILFSSLLNSNESYYIIQAQVLGAPLIKKYNLETIPMGYLVIGEGGTIGFIGKVRGIPKDKPNIAAMYALAAQYLGMRCLYLEAGSGVTSHVPIDMIKNIRKLYDGIIIVGGGINSPEIAKEISYAGADIIVVGSLIEEDDFDERLLKINKNIKR